MGSWRAAVEDADVVQPQKAAGEDVAPGGILAIHPPVEVQHQALKRAFQEPQVGPAQLLSYLYRHSVAQACTGGLTSLKFHS